MRRVLLFVLILCLFSVSAAADTEPTLLTVEDIFTISCPAGGRVITFPWRAENSQNGQAYYAKMTIPFPEDEAEIQLHLWDWREETYAFSLGSVDETQWEELIPYYAEQYEAFTALQFLEVFSDDPSGVPFFVYQGRAKKKTAFFAVTYIRGWEVQMLCQAVQDKTLGADQCLRLLRQVLGTLELLPGTEIKDCVNVFDQMTFDCPAGWVFSDAYMDALNSPESTDRHFGVLYHEGNMLDINGAKLKGRRQLKDLGERSQEELNQYILEKTREANSSGADMAYQYTFSDNAEGIPFMVFYFSQDGLDVYAAFTVYQGTEIWVRCFSIKAESDMEATELDDLKTVLSTCRPTGTNIQSGD